jgi:murein DD-endopeptidase MepM/ murein hydrolase activator NlpD
VDHANARRARRALTAPALIAAIACSAFVTGSAAAEPASPSWLATDASVYPEEPVQVVPGLTVRPEAPESVLPLTGYRITATFGSAGGLWSSGHTGLDFGAPEGTALVAIGPGVVTEVAYDGAYGSKTVIRLEDGTVLWYCHQSRQDVAVGDHVAAGDVIGAVGSTGNTTGAHLHLEVRTHGEPIDPAAALAGWGIAP